MSYTKGIRRIQWIIMAGSATVAGGWNTYIISAGCTAIAPIEADEIAKLA
jgi:hypothetical protein